MLYLLDKDTKTVKWNGIPLHEAGSAIVKEETNGDFYLTVHYPITDSGIYQLIKEDMLIKAPTPVLGPQLFRIKKPVENDDSLDITAYHITDDVMQRSINPVSVVGQGCAMALSRMVQNAKTGLGDFSFTSDIMDSRTFNTTETETLYSVLLDGKHSIVGTWEGELVRDNFALTIKRSRGADRGVVITTHKNLKSYQRTKNSQNVVTRIHARSTFRAEGAETDTVLTVTVDSPLIGNYPYINEKEYENNNAETVEDLRKWAEAKFTNEGIDKVSDAIEIEAYELDGQVVHLGDTVNIKSRKHDVDIYKKAIAYEYNALTEEYISITFDDKPGVGGSGVSSGLSNAADVILSANQNAQEVAIERAVRNANKAFDAELDKRVEVINDGIEQVKAEAELYADNIKQSIDADINAVNTSMQAQSDEHDRQVADILSKTQSVEELANQAKSDAASAITQALLSKDEAIADATAQVATVSQALNTAKTDLQNQVNVIDAKAVKVQLDVDGLRTDLDLQAGKILEQAQAQTALTSRVSTVETLADGTKTTVTELSKTVSDATGDIASVTSRTKTIEDSLSQTRTQYDTLMQTVNTQTGQIDSINLKTADLQSGIDGVTERFGNLMVGGENLIDKTGEPFVMGFGITNTTWNPETKRTRLTFDTSVELSKYTEILPQGGIFETQNIVIKQNQTYTQAIRVATDATFLGAGNLEFSWYGTEVVSGTYEHRWYKGSVRKIGVNEYLIWSTVTWDRPDIRLRPFDIYNLHTALDFRNTGTFLEFYGPKLETGNVPTDWCESNTDFNNQIAEYKRTSDQNYAGLQSTVSTLDGKVAQNKTEVNQTTTQLSNRLISVEAYKDGEATRSQSYFEASKTETARQITAERTAISANYVAKSTYDENVLGTTLKLNEIKTTADTAKQNLATYQETVDRKLTELTSSTQTLDGKINTASAKVDTVAGQIRTEISTVEGKIPTELGVRNYILKSQAELVSASGFVNKMFNFSSDLLSNLSKIKTVTISCDVEGSNVTYFNNEKRYGLACSAEIDGVLHYWEVWQTEDTTKKRISQTFTVPEGKSITNLNNPILWIRSGGNIKVSNPKLELGSVPTDHTLAPEDSIDELSSVKTTITQTATGVEQLSTSLSTTNNKVTTAETKINQLISDVSSKVSQSEYNTLTGRVSSAETAITQNATEISKRLTSTQVESAITGKGYQTKSDVDNNINSALQPYALSTTVQNLVNETADSFSRTISETKALIPTSIGSRNYIRNGDFSEQLTHWEISSLLDSNYSLAHSLSNKGKTGFHWYAYPMPQFGGVNQVVPNVSGDADQKVAISFSVAKDGIGGNITVRLHFRDSTDSIVGDELKQLPNNFDDAYKRYSMIFTAPAAFESLKVMFSGPEGQSSNLYLTDVQLELADIASDYHKAIEDLATVTALHNVTDTVDSHTRTIGAVGTTGSILDNVSKVTQTANGLVTEVSGTNGLKTQVSQLAGSYAIQNLTNSGTVLNQINLNKDGSVRIDGSLVQITGTTYIQDGVISSAKIANLDAGKITTGTLNAARIAVNSIDGSKLVFDQAFFNNFTADEAYLKQIFAKNAFITSVQSTNISADKITTGTLNAANVNVINMNANNITTGTLNANLISGGVLKSTNGATNFDLNNGNLLFNNNYGYIRRTANDKIFEITTLLTEKSNYSSEVLSSKFMVRKSDFSRQSGVSFDLYTTIDGKPTATTQIYSDSFTIKSSDYTTLFSLGSKNSYLGTFNLQNWGDIPVAVMTGGLDVKDIAIGGHTESLLKVVERLCTKTGLIWV